MTAWPTAADDGRSGYGWTPFWKISTIVMPNDHTSDDGVNFLVNIASGAVQRTGNLVLPLPCDGFHQGASSCMLLQPQRADDEPLRSAAL